MEYALEGITNQLFVARYQLYLPKREELQAQLDQALGWHGGITTIRQQVVGELETVISQALLDQFKLRGSPITFKDTLKL